MTDALGSLIQVFIALPAVAAVAFLAVRFLILPLIHKWDAFHEFIFLAAVGWCLTVATLSRVFALSFEIGAFIAGVSLATSPIALYIAENLRPLRDFFLVLFFFSVGAAIDMSLMIDVWLPTLTLAVTLVAIKPVIVRWLLGWQGEARNVSWEAGIRPDHASGATIYRVNRRGERHSVWWPARSSKPVLGGDPVQGRFDSYAAPPRFLLDLRPVD